MKMYTEILSFSPLFYIYHPFDGMSITGGFSACLNLDMDLIWQPSFIHNAQLTIDLAPVSDGSCPFFGGFKGGQIQGFQQCCIARENASLLVESPIGGI